MEVQMHTIRMDLYFMFLFHSWEPHYLCLGATRFCAKMWLLGVLQEQHIVLGI